MGVLTLVVDGQVLSLTLRVVFNMFNSVREHMKVQGYLTFKKQPPLGPCRTKLPRALCWS